ncbi:MAG: SRPBCC family protein [Thermoplasmata archaeon]|nr:SRPBCC family protein [Thermoplasmata archaeon]
MDKKSLPKRVESSLVVNARPEQVFPLLEDPHSAMKWVTFLGQVQWAKGSGIGAKDRCQLEIAGMKVWMGAQVDVYEKNVRIGRRSVEGMKMRSEVHLVPEGPNTRVDWTMSYRPPWGPIGFLMDALMMRKAIVKGVTASLGRLKRLAESGYKPIPFVGADDLRAALTKGTPPVLVDVRDPEDFAKPNGAIPGSFNIPIDQFPSRMEELEKFRDREVVTICYAGRMAGEAAELLRGRGFPGAKVLLGGLSSWRATANAA